MTTAQAQLLLAAHVYRVERLDSQIRIVGPNLSTKWWPMDYLDRLNELGAMLNAAYAEGRKAR